MYFVAFNFSRAIFAMDVITILRCYNSKRGIISIVKLYLHSEGVICIGVKAQVDCTKSS